MSILAMQVSTSSTLSLKSYMFSCYKVFMYVFKGISKKEAFNVAGGTPDTRKRRPGLCGHGGNDSGGGFC
jgi:hypothetical protein